MKRSLMFWSVWLTAAAASVAVPPALAQETPQSDSVEANTRPQVASHPNLAQINDLGEVQVAQSDQSAVLVTAVRLNQSETGIELILETATASLLAPNLTTIANALIADIPNAVLALPDQDQFQAAAPAPGIAFIAVTSTPTGIRVAVTGTEAPPAANVTVGAQRLAIALTPGVPSADAPEAAIQITVTGEREDYSVTDAAVGTRTDTPLLEVPQSIQVVPEAVIDDQAAITLNDALRNVSGVQPSFASARSPVTAVIIRGFNSDNFLINGLSDTTFGDLGVDLSNVDRVEVLKGPASVLYGLGDLGGTINVVTEQPLREPFYEQEYQLNSFGLHRSAIDLSGPLNASQTLLYRLNAAIEFGGSFVDFEEVDSRPFIAPVLSWQIDDDTTFTLEASYLRNNTSADAPALPAVGTVIDNPNGEIDLDVNLGEPDLVEVEEQVSRIGYRLEHDLSDNWSIRNEFNGSFFRELTNTVVFPLGLCPDVGSLVFLCPSLDQRTLLRALVDVDTDRDSYTLNNSVTGQFSTGSIDHTLLLGAELSRETVTDRFVANLIAPIDIFDPVYVPSFIGPEVLRQDLFTRTDALGLYVQDQIAFNDNLILVLGGRFDIAGSEVSDRLAGTDEFQQDEAFSPRLGLVYQPSEDVSLYASYARSFTPQAGQTATGETFEPERGTQYEVGVKANLLNDQVFATLAFFDLTRNNVLTADPSNSLFQIQTGEQRSRGIELDLQGEVLPGWSLIASYTFTDAEITEDEVFDEGSQLFNVPRHSASLWSVYELQQGDLQGLGFGLGLFFVGDREGNLNNTFELPAYVRSDAMVYYQRDQVRFQLNFQNLFDIDYFEASRSGNDLEIVAGEPLTVLGTVSWQF
ncbi:TonB-dependent siderophore receptor [Almyronema epifaneia]|uniref:TonB-dependent siderophore receptor n=1 Tax=Almyronema epifaneia S1 TaxID=2991925 RepID=A0ABW6IGR5_9CYAN